MQEKQRHLIYYVGLNIFKKQAFGIIGLNGGSDISPISNNSLQPL